MYDEHVPPIAATMRSDPEAFARGCTFVILTIRQMITVVPRQMAEVSEQGEHAAALFGHKREAFRYVQAHRDALWRDMLSAPDAVEAVRVMTRVPGLGIVKSAFVAQLMGFDVACVDSRNADREGRDRDAYRMPAKKDGKRAGELIAQYVADVGGRSRELWDAWCGDVARVYRRTAEDISALHLACIVQG